MTDFENAARAVYEKFPLTSGTGMPRKADGTNYTWDEVVKADGHLAQQSRIRVKAVIESTHLDPSEAVVEAMLKVWNYCMAVEYSEDMSSEDITRAALRAVFRAAGMQILEQLER